MAASATETYDEAIQNELELHRLTGEKRHLERAFRYRGEDRQAIRLLERHSRARDDARSEVGAGTQVAGRQARPVDTPRRVR